MQYISTRGNTAPMAFSDVLLMGLAPDGGLMLPQSYPTIDEATLDAWRKLDYTELAYEIMSLYATDIPLRICAISSIKPTPNKPLAVMRSFQ